MGKRIIKPRNLSSFKLPIAGETIFKRPHKRKLSKDVQQRGVYINRIFAKGGYVVTQYADYDKGSEGQVLMPPMEALRRAQSLKSIPPQFVMEGMIQAIIEAAHAAMQQTLDGGNPLFEQNKDLLNVSKQVEAIKAEIMEVRKVDPVLDEEMKKVEFYANVKKGEGL